MSSGGTYDSLPIELPVAGRMIKESPPEWWDEYPFDASEPDWDSVELFHVHVDSGTFRNRSRVVGPNCIPVPISSIRELHYIAPKSNLESILKLGILSHNQARPIPHLSVANPSVNNRRADKRLSSDNVVHDYANLYFNGRNPMLSALLKSSSEPLCIVRVAARVLRLKGVIVTDGNAASDPLQEFTVHDDRVPLDRAKVFLRYWPVPDNPQQEKENKRCMMAEVLVPNIISPHFIEGIYVGSQGVIATFAPLIDRSMIQINEHLFFGHYRK